MKTLIYLFLVIAMMVLGGVVQAQQPEKIARIGYLGAFTPSAGASLLDAFRQGLREFGYVEGQNIFIDYRWAEGKPDRLPVAAAELVNIRAEVIVTQSNAAAAALQQATKTIPIIVAGMGDPVESGFVASLARPGRNMRLPASGYSTHYKRVAELTMKNRLPAISTQTTWVDAGGLMSYGPDFSIGYRRAATYVDKILKGAKPADLPVEQPTKFELVINLKTAKALGLTIPQAVLLRADEVIQ